MPLRQEIKERLDFPILPYLEALREQRASIREWGAENPHITSVMEKARKQMQRAALPWLVIGITTFGGLPFIGNAFYQHFEEKKERREITAQQEDIEIQSRHLRNWVQWLKGNPSALLTKESELETFERIMESMENLGNRESLLLDREVRKKILEEQRIILDWLKKISVTLNAPGETFEVFEAMEDIEMNVKLSEATNSLAESARKVSEAVQSVTSNKCFFDGDATIQQVMEASLRKLQEAEALLRVIANVVSTKNFDSKKRLFYTQICDSRTILESLFQQMIERAKILKERSDMYEEKSFKERKNLIENMLQSMEQKLQRILTGNDLPSRKFSEDTMETLKKLKEIQQQGYKTMEDQKTFFVIAWTVNELIDEWILEREKVVRVLHDIMP